MTTSFPLLLILLLPCLCRGGGSEMVLISAPSQSNSGGAATPTFRIEAKSRPLVARVGDTVDLSCVTDSAWHLCSWKQPQEGGVGCYRLSTDKYASSCHGDARIRYQVSNQCGGGGGSRCRSV